MEGGRREKIKDISAPRRQDFFYWHIPIAS